MKSSSIIYIAFLAVFLMSACGPVYQARPLGFSLPSQGPRTVRVAGALIEAESFADATRAREAFGFDVIATGLLPVQLVFDNQGRQRLAVDAEQTFLEDSHGKLWAVLEDRFARRRVARGVQARNMAGEAVYNAAIGGVAGAVVGAASGVVRGDNVGESAGKGAAVGAAAGAVAGGVKGMAESDRAVGRVMEDFRSKSITARTVEAEAISSGFVFFPAEAAAPRKLRLSLRELDSDRVHSLELPLL